MKNLLMKNLLAKKSWGAARPPLCPSPSEVRYALQDVDTREVYPLPDAFRWLDAYFVLEACRAGEDVGLPVPPRAGARLRIIIVYPPAERERRAREAAEARARADAEIAALFGDSLLPSPPLTWWGRAAEALQSRCEALHRWLCRGDVTLLVIGACAVCFFVRRAL